MKKLFVLTLALVLTLGTAAMAANVTVGGSLEATVGFDLDGSDVVPEPASDKFVFGELKLSASEEGLWSGSVVVAPESTDTWGFSFGKYSLELLPENFVVNVWGNGFELSEKKDFFGFVSSGKAATNPKVRVATDALGFSLTADYEGPVADDPETTEDDEFVPGAFYAFGEGTVEGLTIGGAFKNTFGRNAGDEDARKVAGYLTYPVDIATLTVGGGYDLAAEESGYAVKGVVTVTDEVTLTGQYANNLALDDTPADEYYVQADYLTDNIDAYGKYAVDTLDATTISGEVVYRQDGAVDFGDLFGDYNLLTGYAVKAFASSKTTANATDNATLTLKGAAAAPLAANVWAKADVTYIADEDGVLVEDEDSLFNTHTYETMLNVNGALFVQLTEKLDNESTLGYTSWKTEDASELSMDTTFTYALSDSASLSAALARVSTTAVGAEEADVDTTATFGFKVSF